MRHSAPANTLLLWPPRLVDELRRWLSDRYPDKDKNLLGVAANQIDALVRDMLRAGRGVKIKKGPDDKRKLSAVQRASVVDALRRIEGTTGKPHLYKKAIAEAPADAIALIEQVRGSSEWTRCETTTGFSGFPIPAPSAVAPHLPEAIALASASGDWSGWRRDRTVMEVAIWFERITGEKPRQSSKAAMSRRSGLFPDFLDGLECFYNARLPDGFKLKFGVQNSGSGMARALRR